MPDNFEPPPWPEHGFTKRMYAEWIDDLWQWLRDHRVVAVKGGFLTDAPGGGKQVEVSAQSLVGATVQGFTLIGIGTTQCRVTVSLLAGDLPTGFVADDSTPFILTVAAGDIIYAVVTWDVSGETAGGVTSRTIANYPSAQTDDQSTGTFYYQIGAIDIPDEGPVTPTQYRYGPIQTEIARVWYVTDKTFLVSGQ